jgi:hypothetical protein
MRMPSCLLGTGHRYAPKALLPGLQDRIFPIHADMLRIDAGRTLGFTRITATRDLLKADRQNVVDVAPKGPLMRGTASASG